MVQRYKALADIERGFRVLKSEIEIAPVYHRLPERIRAHALVYFLALIVYGVMRPPRHNSCRLLRNQEHGDGDEGHLWHVTDNHSRTEL